MPFARSVTGLLIVFRSSHAGYIYLQRLGHHRSIQHALSFQDSWVHPLSFRHAELASFLALAFLTCNFECCLEINGVFASELDWDGLTVEAYRDLHSFLTRFNGDGINSVE